MTLDRAFGQAGDMRDVGNGQLIQVIQGQHRTLQGRQSLDGSVQMCRHLRITMHRFDIDAIGNRIRCRQAILAVAHLGQWNATSLEMAFCDRIGNLANP